MEQTDYPWRGNGATKDITGTRFTISVMSDNFVPMIRGAIKNVDTKKVWSKTDALSTVYRGKRIHVMDCLKACFVQANDGYTHITMEATVSKGSPADVDDECLIEEDDILLNNNSKKFNVMGKISFYPLGIENYMDHIAHIARMAMDKSLFIACSHYVTMLKGDINDMFDYFNAVLAYAEQNISHHVMQITLSVNSPTGAGI